VALREITATLGDITRVKVDAIVNAANSALIEGGGVDHAIHEAAGRAELDAACAALGGCDPGDAKATTGFHLPARWIVHTVGPIWHGGSSGEAEVLASCYRRSLDTANELGARSLPFPAIATGVFGFPEGLAAEIAVNALRSHEAPVVTLAILVAFDATSFRVLEDALGR
jgi:O-acetyl-ADP-ribose deacetylase (regulator of RNase III)